MVKATTNDLDLQSVAGDVDIDGATGVDINTSGNNATIAVGTTNAKIALNAGGASGR